MYKRKLRGGILGGGLGSFIGPVHHMAGILDGEAEFVAGVFSSDPRKSKQSGRKYHINPSRIYADYQEMANAEASLHDTKRIDFVSITTPNVFHFDMAKTFLEKGIHVVCEKPMTCNLVEAKELKNIVDQTGRIFVLMHAYTGYPMIKQAKHLVSNGLLGKINKVVVDYSQGSLAPLLQETDSVSCNNIWRLDPDKSGLSGTSADIGTHAENLVRYITGLQIERLCADLSSFIPNNILDDDSSMLIRYKGGAKGLMNASQISTGEKNRLSIRIYGSKSSLVWDHESPGNLIMNSLDGTTVIYSEGNSLLCEDAKRATRLPAGHPEGMIEAFANIYTEAYRAMHGFLEGKPRLTYDFPTVDDGVIGMSFVETAIASTRSRDKWVRMK